MASYEERYWDGAHASSGLPRRDRQGGAYRVYIPDRLVGRSFVLGGEEAADVADAERAIATLDAGTSTLADTEALARLLLRAESVASSRIEGLVVGARRLLEADVAMQFGEPQPDVTAAEVLANIDAMAYAIAAIRDQETISIAMLLETHRRLLSASDLASYGGQIRMAQNWIGGSSYNPCAANFVPPPPEIVEDLLRDLCEFCNTDVLPAVAQAAIAHAQFETIHPFADGNGRVGRALIHLVLRRRGLTSVVTPPISLVLATRALDYVAGLRATAYVGEPESPQAVAGLNRWMGTFAAACTRAVSYATAFEHTIAQIQQAWRAKLGPTRADASVLKILSVLPGAPVTTVAAASKLIGRSLPSTLEGIQRLVNVGILSPSRAARQRGQVFEAREVIAAFTNLERQLASPAGDTKIEIPTRPVPGRPTMRL